MELSGLEILGLSLCFIFSGFFSGSEAVLMSIGIDRARQIIAQGGNRGRAMLFMVEKPSELLTTILVGNNIANIFAASLTTAISSRIFKEDAISISVGITTFVILIFGEIIPKTFARTHAEAMSSFVIRVLQFFYYSLFPVIKAMVWIIHRVLGENAQLRGQMVTKNDIEYMINKAEQENSMDSKQIELLSSILEFPNIKVKDIMIPRNQVKYLTKDMTFEEILEYVKDDAYTRYPVGESDLDTNVGFLHIKDLAFIQNGERENFDIESHVKSPFFVYEHMKINAVFDHMNRKKVHLALVKDENGLVVGIITLEDIIEEIMGDIHDEHDDEETANNVASDVFKEGILLAGSTSLRDLYTDYDIKIPLNDNFSTIAGFILDMLGNNFPEQGQIIVWEGLSFELESVDEFEIRDIRIKAVDGGKHLYSRKDSTEQKIEENVTNRDDQDTNDKEKIGDPDLVK